MDGYELGIKVEEDWWKELCAANPSEEFAKTAVDYDPVCGWARLSIAVIPYAAFAIFHTGDDYELFHKLWDGMDAKLAPGSERRKTQTRRFTILGPGSSTSTSTCSTEEFDGLACSRRGHNER
jgi:hypothetical protein